AERGLPAGRRPQALPQSARAGPGLTREGADLAEPTMLELGSLIRDIPDFPKKGILFKDITTLLKDARAFKQSIDQLTDLVRGYVPRVVIGMESRGFIFAAPIA